MDRTRPRALELNLGWRPPAVHRLHSMPAKFGLLLLLLGCGDALPPLQTTALAGATVDLRRFEGRWFNCDGDLIAVIDDEARPQFAVRLPTWLRSYGIENARLQAGELRFNVRSDERAGPILVSLELHSENSAVISQVLPRQPGFICGTAFLGRPVMAAPPVQTTVLLREPSVSWLSERRTAAYVHRAYDYVFDWRSPAL
jgi:hypothetical protein